ncbi:MAG TPA: PDZ domain-containing protein [Candidatus Binatia bacterium]|nr:PDZ domain-containing protein [Candidatus Binatia bacterium]
MPAGRTVTFVLLTFLLTPIPSVLAQQSPAQQGSGWQGARPRQHPAPVPSVQEPKPSAIPQPPPSLPSQNEGAAHPQVMEMPAAQTPPTPELQPDLSVQQPVTTTPSVNLPSKPAYLGVAGQTVLSCRYPAGVRITRVIEGSPAHKAGLKGEGILTWQQAMGGVLTLTPLAPLILPFFTNSEHGGSGDLILAVDGKRIHDREELEREMLRFRPGDTVYFSILREQSGVRQIPVQLAESPDTATTAMAR